MTPSLQAERIQRAERAAEAFARRAAWPNAHRGALHAAQAFRAASRDPAEAARLVRMGRRALRRARVVEITGEPDVPPLGG